MINKMHTIKYKVTGKQLLIMTATLLVALAIGLVRSHIANAACSPITPTYGSVTSNVTIPASGTYRVWSRMSAPDYTNNSYFLEVGDNVCAKIVGDNSAIGTNLTWINYTDGNLNAPLDVTLVAGTYPVRMIGREFGVSLDKVIFVPDLNCNPNNTDCEATIPDTPPTVSVTASPTTVAQGDTVNLTATATDNDNTPVAKVDFYDGTTLLSTDTTSPHSYAWTTSASTTTGTHSITAIATDTANLVSSVSNIADVTVNTPPDTSSPIVTITNPTQNANITSGYIVIGTTTSDNVGVVKVDFYINGNLVKSDVTSLYSYNWVTSAETNGTYTILAKAYDAAGNMGTNSITVTVNNPDTTPPSVSITAPVCGSTINGTVSISANANDNVGVSKVGFNIDTSTPQIDTTSPYEISWDTTISSNGDHTIVATAYDAAGNPSTVQCVVTVANPDITPPSAPTNLVATATSLTNVNLSWTASTDNVGVTGYYILRTDVLTNTTTTLTQTTGTGTTYSDSTVTANTSYKYQVIAQDAAGNSSVLSNIASVTTPAPPPPPAPPSAPTNLSASPYSAYQQNLTWTASTGGAGAKTYDIYRDNAKIGTSSTTSFSDASVFAETTYKYYVIATDTIPQSSVPSTTLTVKTPVPLYRDDATLKGTTYYHIGTSTTKTKLPSTTINIPYKGTNHYYSSSVKSIYQIIGLRAIQSPTVATTTYTIVFSKSGYSPISYNVTLAAKQVLIQDANLTKNP